MDLADLRMSLGEHFGWEYHQAALPGPGAGACPIALELECFPLRLWSTELTPNWSQGCNEDALGKASLLQGPCCLNESPLQVMGEQRLVGSQ